MYEWKINDEQRVILNLSDLANAVIEQDMLEFNSKSKSAFVCRVFESYYQKAEASIAKTLADKEDEFCKDLANIPVEMRTSIIDTMLVQIREKLIKKQTEYEKGGASSQVRLHNDTLACIRECMNTESEYYRNISSYVKSVMEEYCRLPYVEREKIYFKNSFDKIEAARKEKHQLRVTIQDGRQFMVYPQSLETDRLNTATYLAGYSRLPGQKKADKIAASFRISNLIDVKRCDDTFVLSKDDEKALANLIQKRGIEFLMHEETEIRVRLTPKGVYKLSRMLHLRPRCSGQEGDVYTFRCTEMQAEFYFIGMGADCEILEPESLRNRFSDIFTAAEKIYKK